MCTCVHCYCCCLTEFFWEPMSSIYLSLQKLASVDLPMRTESFIACLHEGTTLKFLASEIVMCER